MTKILPIIILILSILYSPFTFGQVRVAVKDNHGKITVYENSHIDKILNVSKYINTRRPVNISFGTNVFEIDSNLLKHGFNPFSTDVLGDLLFIRDNKIFTIKMVHKKLLVSCDLPGFDEAFVAKIKDNRLIAENYFYENGSDMYMEIFDKYDIPILQIELIKKTNTIYIGGAFHNSYGFYIANTYYYRPVFYEKKKLLMTEDERNKWLDYYLTEARRSLKPLSEIENKIREPLPSTDTLEKK